MTDSNKDFSMIEETEKTLTELDNKLLALRVEKQKIEIDLKFTRKFLAMLKTLNRK